MSRSAARRRKARPSPPRRTPPIPLPSFIFSGSAWTKTAASSATSTAPPRPPTRLARQTSAMNCAATLPVAPPPPLYVTFSGTPQEGQTLTATPHTTDPAAIVYLQWQRLDQNGGFLSNIDGATSTTYTPGPADLGDELRGDAPRGPTSTAICHVQRHAAGRPDPHRHAAHHRSRCHRLSSVAAAGPKRRLPQQHRRRHLQHLYA